MPLKSYPTLTEYARHMLQETTMAEDRTDIPGRAALNAEQDGKA